MVNAFDKSVRPELVEGRSHICRPWFDRLTMNGLCAAPFGRGETKPLRPRSTSVTACPEGALRGYSVVKVLFRRKIVKGTLPV